MKLIWIELFKFGDGQFMFVCLKKQIDSSIFDFLLTTVYIFLNLNLIMLINV